jgi:hypothetical protein
MADLKCPFSVPLHGMSGSNYAHFGICGYKLFDIALQGSDYNVSHAP